MAKGKKPTTQELYELRRQREEQEKEAYLPPGLINHGNTCFMNSVLQGLIATPLLYNLVHFQPIPPSIQNATSTPPILSSRSPQLTNGHRLGGDYEKEWVEGMPLGDTFFRVMEKAWDIQNDRRRESMSPKDLLSAIGRKYDQYLDFRQQDAHEFLSHLLDAMRMEEKDIIKKRQPPPPSKRKRKRSPKQPSASTSTAGTASPRPPPVRSSLSTVPEVSTSEHPGPVVDDDPTSPPIPDEEKLATFSDMLFGGKLASILVCEKCKHISCTYEDFNDLSLSIKPEDYVRERKRDKLKTFAKKLRLRPGTSPGQLPNQSVRSSSVPASPIRRSSQQAADHEPPVEDHVRRRSIDATPVTEEPPGTGPMSLAASTELEGPPQDEWQEIGDGEAKQSEEKGSLDRDHIEFVEQERPEKEKKDKDKDDNDWVKLGRRISMSMSMGIGKKDRERKSRSMERSRSSRSERSKSKAAYNEDVPSSPASFAQTFSSTEFKLGQPPSPAIAIKGGEDIPSRGASPSPNLTASPFVSGSPRLPIIRRAGSPSLIGSKHVKTPRPPKLSREESAYLRRLLADVPLPPSSSPLAMFRPPSFSGAHPHHHGHGHHHPPHSATSTAAQNLWAKLGHLPSIEECLRLFTSVEVLDDDNMVGCRRCWKIANGTYYSRSSKAGKEIKPCAGIDVEDSDSEEDSEESSPQEKKAETRSENAPERSPSASPAIRPVSLPASVRNASSEPVALPEAASEILSPASSTASLSAQSARSTESSILNAQGDDGTSLSSVAATVASSLLPAYRSKPSAPPAPLNLPDEPGSDAPQANISPHPPVSAYGGLPIPSISTTAPESPLTSAQTVKARSERPLPDLPQDPPQASSSKDSLRAPRIRFGRSKREGKGDESDSDLDSDSEDSDTESNASSSVTGFSDGSPMMSPYASPVMSQENLSSASRSAMGLGLSLGNESNATSADNSTTRVSEKKKIPRSKQVIMRRAYKRYLIATAPPILIIHLKRFQQVSKHPSFSSFSSGFKKLDDFVSFPEYLDLGPYLAPHKEDFGLGTDGVEQRPELPLRSKGREKCMYRLYAVVVHIGNMLGGHYIAYTALPDARSPLRRSGSQQSSTGELSGDAQPGNAQSQAQSASSGATKPADSPRQWAYISDTVVRLTTLDEVLKAKAYLCMYERV